MTHENLAAALAAFQAELPKLRRDETAKVKGETKDGRPYDRSYSYADLGQVVEIVLPVLGKHGLSVTSKSTWSNGEFILLVSLLHTSGEKDTADWPLPDPRRYGPQDIGSSMTYGRRYLTLALSGVYPGGEDDDGARAQQSARESFDEARPRRNAPVEEDAVRRPATPPKTEWTDEEIGKYHHNIETVELAKAVNGYDWMASKGLHNREIPLAGDDAIMLSATDILAGRLAEEAVKPTLDADTLATITGWAEARGLMKVQVSESETLNQVLVEAHAFLTAATVDASANAQQLRETAAASWPEDTTGDE